jgi:hypothetical protein
MTKKLSDLEKSIREHEEFEVVCQSEVDWQVIHK